MGRQTAYAGLYRLYRQCHHQEWEMLLHRVGAITCDMLFDTLTATMVDYKAYMVGAKFLLHTETYSIEENETGLTIRVQYTLDDSSGHTPIVGEQEIVAVFN